MVNLVELCKNLERKIAKLYQFSLLVNQISDIVELFNCGVRKKGNSMAFFPLLSIRLLCSGNWY
ncbi:hypothetical protein wCauA_05565 [Wolbachia endosymbiont of Carposina sasakii]|uniref:hypothetical protein n=1 Tax=Wolbachia TaxID=953 RepID=UPI0003A31EE0|nr:MULTISPECIES: hypothetical protein [Wolbachia]AOV87394.1 hypothetical protein WG67_02325 [Wolbachia endosymbiont of Drosophila incompta]MDX5507470.1 hypothetical protein [Wolbachia endosymbiont of Hylaeus sinuatus]MEC4734597.1 hypothetical protein [Wolbachia endosymbiont of Halictus tumulorum]MBA8752774.1 hypothetical protein [Wolbachia pipientis]MBA8753793.1 hypothetical protein [Wolbachia pipientis]